MGGKSSIFPVGVNRTPAPNQTRDPFKTVSVVLPTGVNTAGLVNERMGGKYVYFVYDGAWFKFASVRYHDAGDVYSLAS